MLERSKRKVLKGVVTSNKMEKTVTVQVTRSVRHPKYGKLVEKRKKFYAHHEGDSILLGQEVRIMECRPLSKLKRWRVVEVLTK
ncbi:MAG: 30S ribosomal protein S17 [Chlamydiota bacterium]